MFFEKEEGEAAVNGSVPVERGIAAVPSRSQRSGGVEKTQYVKLVQKCGEETTPDACLL